MEPTLKSYSITHYLIYKEIVPTGRIHNSIVSEGKHSFVIEDLEDCPEYDVP
jgi:hypothetical protein